jgi:hypothetical protein
MLATENAVVSKIADLIRYCNAITMHPETRAKIEVISFVERSSLIEISTRSQVTNKRRTQMQKKTYCLF